MKKYFVFIIILCFLIPTLQVNACNITVSSNYNNYTCTSVTVAGDKKFYYENVNYSQYFEINGTTINIVDMEGLMSSFPTTVKVAKIELKNDGKIIGIISVENSKYVEPSTSTTTTSTTTTTQANQQTFTVTLVHNNGTNETTQRVCTVAGNDGYCTVTLPTLDEEKFNGWGTAATCKDGSSGSIRLEENTTLYACYENQTQTSTSETPLLKTLTLLDEDTNEEIDFGVFSIKQTNYEFSVENDVKNIKIDATADDGINIIYSGNQNLNEGENIITIKLTNESGKENIYTFTVTRLKSGETIDNNHYLSNLTIGGYQISFDKNIFNYTVTVSNEVTKLELDYEAEEDRCSITEVGNSNLENGSVIKLNVTCDDENTTTYTINIIKEVKDNSLLMIIAGVIIFIILVLVIVVFVKSNKKQSGNISKNKEEKQVKNKNNKKTKSKKNKNEPQVLPESKEEIEVLKF